MTAPRGVRGRRSAWSSVIASGALAVAGALTLTAQAPPAPPPAQPPQPQRPVIRTEANYVRVDAYPTVDGKPVMDLKAEDFEVLEDGVVQKVQAFEHIVVRPAGPQDLRVEPNSIEASRQLAASPYNRVFVLFLDVGHTTIDGTWHSREALVRLVERVLGPDDLVGIMTPRMAPSDIVFARKTQVLAAGLRDLWPWGERHTLARDEREELYASCYPPLTQDLKAGLHEHPAVKEMRQRRRERMTLDALRSLVDHLRHLREERTAILTVTEGWILYRPNEALTTLRTDEGTNVREPASMGAPIGVGPDGRLGIGNKNSYPPGSEGMEECDRDRITLAHLDNDRYFKDLLGAANRANASFYTIDPRGLPVWDNPLGPEPPPPILVDQEMLKVRRDSMHVLANETDGMVVPYTNNLDVPLKRIADDLTSYYLLGYYSSNPKLDGRYRRIEVRVKRSGVDVRARRGYRAPTQDEIANARAATPAAAAKPATDVASAFTELARVRDDTAFLITAGPRRDESTRVTAVWVAGEIRRARGEQLAAGEGMVEIQIAGGARGMTEVTLTAGQRAFLVDVPLDKPAEGALDVRARLSGLTVVPYTDNVRIEPGPRASGAVAYRRGPSTGTRYEPVGVMLFNRTERVRLELALAPGASATAARVLDRGGKVLQVPVALTERTDAATGQRVAVADLTLAPLTIGDYAVEVTVKTGDVEGRSITAIRIGR